MALDKALQRHSTTISYPMYFPTKVSPPLFLRDGNKLSKIIASEIVYVEASDNYAYIHLGDRKVLVPQTLKAIAAKLPLEQFVRAHRSYLVNLNHIDRIMSDHLLINQEKIKIGKVYKASLLARIQVI